MPDTNQKIYIVNIENYAYVVPFVENKEEKELLEEFERGEWIPVKDQAKARKRAMEAARNTLNKTKNINIRLTERDLFKLKARAAQEGIPYQTLVSSILHRFTNE